MIHQIENKTYEKYLRNQTNFDAVLPEKIKQQAYLAVKDHYTFDFLELAHEQSEYELEQALIKNTLVSSGNWLRFYPCRQPIQTAGKRQRIPHRFVIVSSKTANFGCYRFKNSRV